MSSTDRREPIYDFSHVVDMTNLAPDTMLRLEAELPHHAHALHKMESAAQAEARFDTVDRPEHYASGEIECIDAIAAAMTADQFRGYLRGNAFKYLWRHERKGGVEDLRKAQWYLDRLVGTFKAA